MHGDPGLLQLFDNQLIVGHKVGQTVHGEEGDRLHGCLPRLGDAVNQLEGFQQRQTDDAGETA